MDFLGKNNANKAIKVEIFLKNFIVIYKFIRCLLATLGNLF